MKEHVILNYYIMVIKLAVYEEWVSVWLIANLIL